MRASDRDASFQTLFEPHRRSVTLHCYRMLGSLQDAEEIVQESLLRAWQRRDEVKSISAVRGWLYTIATNECLDVLRKARRRRALPHLLGTPPSAAVTIGAATEEALWIEPAPDSLFDVEDDASHRPDERVSQREGVGLAFIVALQSLSPRQRAALLLVDVLGWKPEETATVLGATTFSVNSLLQRARRALAARRDETDVREVSSSDAALLRRFIATWESGDLEAFGALLADDAVLSMPPQAEWYAGRDSVRQFFGLAWSVAPGKRSVMPIRANGGPAVALYRLPSAATGPGAMYVASGIYLLGMSGGRVARLTRFDFPKLFPLFGLPRNHPTGRPDLD